uniref:Putative rna-directed dna polymerase from mobile element jockey n=1 Tax=Xenopsylla cheopis TaxID=163159 RepID=A0A6M2DME9_XENCH
MVFTLRIGVWNSNGLAQHNHELYYFLQVQKIDVMLISETHFTSTPNIRFPGYSMYSTNHPDGTAHGGSAIIIRSAIKHCEFQSFSEEYLQASSVIVENPVKNFVIAAIYCPPRHKITSTEFDNFFHLLGPKFIIGGDFNAKHHFWGSRLITPRGHQLYNSLLKNNLNHVSTGEPTYWPSDRSKVPDLLDFCLTKGLVSSQLKAEYCLDLSSDHSPIIISYGTYIVRDPSDKFLTNKRTDWIKFQKHLEANVSCNIPLKNEVDIDNAIIRLNQNIIEAARISTPPLDARTNTYCPLELKRMIAVKRKLRKRWQTTRFSDDKRKFNKAIKDLKHLMLEIKNQHMSDYLSNLSNEDHSIWRATKKIKGPMTAVPPLKYNDGSWARTSSEKADLFANYLENVFTPFPRTCSAAQEQCITDDVNDLGSSKDVATKIKISKIYESIRSSKAGKTPGPDRISNYILKMLPPKALRYITILFNSIIRIKYYPTQWKTARIILIPKPGKDPTQPSSYRPISLLPSISKIFEKIILEKITSASKIQSLIPKQQFGFRHKHATIEQVHRVVDLIHKAIHFKEYCVAAFLDITQAFDKVWHTGLLVKIKKLLPAHYVMLLESYLSSRKFFVNYGKADSTTRPIESGVPQGSVLGPLLYLLYTADIPKAPDTELAIFADDIVVLAFDQDHNYASYLLQNHISKIEEWMNLWRIRANSTKSVQVTFTLRNKTCPAIKLYNNYIPLSQSTKYLGIHLDRRLTWKTHLSTKRIQLEEKRRQLYWLLGRNSKVTTNN